MRIAQVVPLWEHLPLTNHRSAEYSISLLTDELVRRGHDVTLFAAAGSDSLAWLEPGCDQPLAEAKVRLQEYLLHEQIQLSRVFNCPGRFDLIHVQGSLAALPYGQLSKTPVLHSLYEPLSALLAQPPKALNSSKMASLTGSNFD
ncbi:MAG: glycosyltransferase family 4 protein [Synechococcales cyanobacterium RM1_1_8]|nr:glycosyltransferase family 4 protein [Synechococcales cyanobacterium RM1_1_8]